MDPPFIRSPEHGGVGGVEQGGAGGAHCELLWSVNVGRAASG